MKRHDSAKVDNVIVEWLTALIFVRVDAHFHELISLRKILPICCKDLAGCDFFSISDTLSQLVPSASCKAVLTLFEMAGMVLPDHIRQFIDTVSVKEVVEGIMTSMCISVDMSSGLTSVVSKCTTRIMRVALDLPGSNTVM
jgi:hypothetical protein